MISPYRIGILFPVIFLFLAQREFTLAAQDHFIIPRPKSISLAKETLPIRDLRSIIIPEHAFLPQETYLMKEVLAPAQLMDIFRSNKKDAGSHPFWIGFNNISRSHKAPAPPAGVWDDKGSKVWMNDTEVSPPAWKYPGRVCSHTIEFTYRRSVFSKGNNREEYNFRHSWFG